MKGVKFGVFTLLLFVMVIALTGIVGADQVVPAVPETQGLVTGTTADVVGLATETDAGAWTLTNDPFFLYTYTSPDSSSEWRSVDGDTGALLLAQLTGAGGSMVYSINSFGGYQIYQFNVPVSLLTENPPNIIFGNTWQDYMNHIVGEGWIGPDITGGDIHDGILHPGQVQYTTAYDATIVAQAGHTSLIKSMNLNTGNKVISQSNLNAKTLLTYIATADGGDVVGSENLLIDGAGMTTNASDRMLCPFSAASPNLVPAYCNIVQMGSRYDLTVGSVTTEANNRFVGTDATAPLVQNYNIDVRPYSTTDGTVPAMGSVSAYIKAHIQESRNISSYSAIDRTEVPYTITQAQYPEKTEDLTYSESSGAQGTITSFTKVIAYQSGKVLL